MSAAKPTERADATRSPASRRTRTSDLVARRAMAWMGRLARLAAYFVFVGIFLAVVGFKLAVAHAKKLAVDTGGELVRLTGAAHMSGVYRLRLNGEAVKITSASTAASPTAILDRFEAGCREHADGMADDFAHLRDVIAPDGALKPVGAPGAGILRQGDDEQGVVVCFAAGEATKSSAIYERIADFARTGDLGSIGDVRYVMVKRAKGEPTHVVALWTEGSLDVKKMFPEQGDAPGNDAPGVLRPPSARRLMTAYAEGAPYGVRVYESTLKPDAILAEYERVMPKLGWTSHPDAAEAAPFSRAYSTEGRDIIVSTEATDTGTSVSIVEMGQQ